MESKREFIEVQNKNYILLGMYSGVAHLGLPTDVNNEVVKSGVIWEMQPFKYQREFFKLKFLKYRIIRFFKVDVFGNSDFKKFLKNIKV